MLTFLLASNTNYGLLCAKSLINSGFRCVGVLSTTPRLVGRKQTLTPTPVHLWAQTANIPIFFIEKKISSTLEKELPRSDFLLVVDFGYYIPQWLRLWPTCEAINIHPSALPLWRGSSPGQFVLQSKALSSAVSIMAIADKMDAGDLLLQLPFDIDLSWNARDYYDYAFALAADNLATSLLKLTSNELTLTPQSGEPTFAPKLNKSMSFIDFSQLFDKKQALEWERKIRAFNPWPLAWTQVLTVSGLKRLQILTAHLDHSILVLDQVRLEGDIIKNWSDVKSKILTN